MADHYGAVVIPARVRKPRDKAKVEAGVLLAERWILARLRNRRFFSLAEANAEICRLVTVINDRPFKKLPGSRAELFGTLERPAMKALPATRYEFARWRIGIKVNVDYHVDVDRHYYSVPYQLVGRRVDVRMTATTVEVFCSSRRVASHLRRGVVGAHTTELSHMPKSHRRHAEWTPSRIVSWAKHTGPATAALAEAILAARPHPEQGYRSVLGIIRLADRYGAERVEAACRRALFVRSFSYRSVEQILRHGLDKAPPPRIPCAPSPPPAPEPARRRLLLVKGTSCSTTPRSTAFTTSACPAWSGVCLLEQREHPDYAALGFEERLGMLVDRELTERQNRRLQRMLKSARLRIAATTEDVDFRRPRGLERSQILSRVKCLCRSRAPTRHYGIGISPEHGCTGML
jgi:transposase